MIRFNAIRKGSGPPPEVLGRVSKGVDDDIKVAICYDAMLDKGAYLLSMALTAIKLSDRTTQDDSVIVGNAGALVGGTAQASTSATQIVTTANQSILGLMAGDRIVNTTQKWETKVNSLSRTTLIDDTIVFDTQSPAAAENDIWAANIGVISVRNGGVGLSYLIEINSNFSSGITVFDQLLLDVRTAIQGTVPD